MTASAPEVGYPKWWAYLIALTLALSAVPLFATLVGLFERIWPGAYPAWLGALATGLVLAAVAFGFAARWPRHGVIWGLLLVLPSTLAFGLWLVTNQERLDARLVLEILGSLAVLTLLAIYGGSLGRRHRMPRSQALWLAKGPSRDAASVSSSANSRSADTIASRSRPLRTPTAAGTPQVSKGLWQETAATRPPTRLAPASSVVVDWPLRWMFWLQALLNSALPVYAVIHAGRCYCAADGTCPAMSAASCDSAGAVLGIAPVPLILMIIFSFVRAFERTRLGKVEMLVGLLVPVTLLGLRALLGDLPVAWLLLEWGTLYLLAMVLALGWRALVEPMIIVELRPLDRSDWRFRILAMSLQLFFFLLPATVVGLLLLDLVLRGPNGNTPGPLALLVMAVALLHLSWHEHRWMRKA